MSTDATNATRAPAANRASVAEPSFTREAFTGPRKVGNNPVPLSKASLFRYDVREGLGIASKSVYRISQADRMTDSEACDMLDAIHKHFGVQHEPSHVLSSFDTALWLTAALNGTSQLIPSERVQFTMVLHNGAIGEYSYHDVMVKLGEHARRFFRCYAREINRECRIAVDYAGDDPDKNELRLQIIRLAGLRNLSRYPWALSDVADADPTLDDAVQSAVIASKAVVIGASNNAVDKRAVNMVHPIQSLDRFDSSVPVPNTGASRYRD